MKRSEVGLRRGALALVGSGEFTPALVDVDRRLIEHGARVVALTHASAPDGKAVQEQWAESAQAYFESLGAEVIAPLVDISDYVGIAEVTAAIADADVVWLSGGDPLWLADAMIPLASRLKDRFEGGLHVAGSSAGAMALGSMTLPKLERSPKWHQGLGLVSVGVIPHLDAQPDEKVSAMFDSAPPGMPIVGLDERTSLLVNGHARVIGPGRAIIAEEGSRRVVRAPPTLAEVVRTPQGSGPLMMVSSDEFTDLTSAASRRFLELCGPRIALLMCADPESAEETGKRAREHLGRLGADPFIVPVTTRQDALDHKVEDFNGMFIAGGSPATLVPVLKDTPFWRDVVERWLGGAGVAGSSAGAMALCHECLHPGPGDDMPWKWSEGLEALSGFALAVHAKSRPIHWLRQVHATASVPVVALDDAVSLLVVGDDPPSLIGVGDAWVLTEDSLLDPQALGLNHQLPSTDGD